jgi:diaminohydroxyphosphoribosylaminopyrimidine deaminase / 5-amino-6-(5-phosphoribosylamino)uracil reductase
MGKDNYSFTQQDRKYMKLAMQLAAKAKGRTSPNPLVGAVIVDNGRIVSSGYHKKAGLAHAEIEAINNCSDSRLLKGAVMYVSLEPCSFYGKTPPCTEAIIKNGFGKVIAAITDPNPSVSGKGVERLRQAGIEVHIGLLESEAESLNEVFFKHIKTGMPFVTLKIAASIDGKTAASNGHSKWITGKSSRGIVQKLRYESDCVLTGINTVIADDPLLYPRNLGNAKPLPLKDKKFFRVVLDSGLKIAADSKIAGTAGRVKTVIFASMENINDGTFNKRIDLLKEKGMDVVLAPEEPGQGLDLEFILKTLYNQYEITSVLAECGHTLAAGFVKKKLADKFIFFIGPKIIGGDSSYSMFSALGITDVNNATGIRFDSVKRTGRDLMITAYPSDV